MKSRASGGWQHRVADTDEERFGLLDSPKMLRYRKQPLFQEPEGEPPKAELTAFGITSGVGSMLIGARDLGYKVLGNAEWRDYYRYRSQAQKKSTFIENFPGAWMSRGLADVPDDLMPAFIDFAAGHPECGRYSGLSHSVGGAKYQESRKADVSDIPLFLGLVGRLRPRFFLMDDLPGSFAAFPMTEYLKLLPGYDLFPEWISNWGYGNIQRHRNRMFIVGALKSERFTFWPGEAEHLITLKDVIGDLVDVGPGAIPNHAFIDPERSIARYANLRHYGDRPSWAEMMEIFKAEGRWKKGIPYFTPDGIMKNRPGTMDPYWEGPCPVLSGGYNPIHPKRFMPLTVRERARIQGFPDDFNFYHDENGLYQKVWEPYASDGQRGIKQTGKAMPIEFCKFVAHQVKNHILKEPFTPTQTRLLKPHVAVTQAKVAFCEGSGYSDQDNACRACWNRNKCELLTQKDREAFA